MTVYSSSAYTTEQLGDWCRLLSEIALERYQHNQPTKLMSSDVAWQLPGSKPESNIRFWYANQDNQKSLVGFAWFQEPLTLTFDILSDHAAAVLPEVLGWAAECRQMYGPGTMPFLNVTDMDEWRDVLNNIAEYFQHDSRVLITSVFEHEKEIIEQLLSHGFEPTNHFEPHMFKRLEEGTYTDNQISVVSPPDERLDDYATAHRDAWSPGSSFSRATIAGISQVGDLFDRELCLAAEIDGEYAATGIFWFDHSSLLGNIEPFGVRPGFRGQGVSKALIAGGMAKLKAKGAQACRVYTAGFNHQAQRLYRSCDFVDVGIARTFIRALE